LSLTPLYLSTLRVFSVRQLYSLSSSLEKAFRQAGQQHRTLKPKILA
jgi:hypothetical protein